jgi:hypothetical protein
MLLLLGVVWWDVSMQLVAALPLAAVYALIRSNG